MKATYKINLDNVEARSILHSKIEELEGVYWFHIEKYQDKRSKPQNSMYWAMLTEIAEETGNDRDMLHEVFKAKFLPLREVVIKVGNREKVQMVPMSTTQLTKSAFSLYIEMISAFVGQEFGITLMATA